MFVGGGDGTVTRYVPDDTKVSELGDAVISLASLFAQCASMGVWVQFVDTRRGQLAGSGPITALCLSPDASFFLAATAHVSRAVVAALPLSFS